MIRGAIDGHSRTVLYLKCHNNNAETALFEFTQAVNGYGVPSRVRTDKWGENRGIALFMLNHPEWGPGRGSVIAGRSVHNQRQERLWRDVNYGCTHVFYSLFCYMEEQGILDPTNELHIFCLHYVFIPRIDHNLLMFKNGWNYLHGLTTEENKTPTQLWVRGMLQATSNTAASELWEQSTQVCLCIYLIVKKGSWNKTNICHHFLWDFCFRESYICMELTGMGLFLQHHGEFQPTMMLLLFQKQKLILNMTNLFYCSTTLILWDKQKIMVLTFMKIL